MTSNPKGSILSVLIWALQAARKTHLHLFTGDEPNDWEHCEVELEKMLKAIKGSST